MRDTPFEVAHFAFQARPGTPVRTVVVKATYALVPSGECTIASTQRFPTGELYHDDDVQQSLRHPDDLAPFKPRGECFVLGHFHAPHGQPVPHGRIAFQIGPVQKALSVFGERRWTTWGPSEPKPTARVPLRWERAFGGPNVPENPVGCGAETVPQLEDATRLLTSPRDRVPPACTAPLNRTWPVRAKLVGTYDREWLATAYPFLAADVRLEYFCAAPPDQRIEGHWRGDETIVLVNIVPEWPHVHCRLPGLWPRAAWVTTDAPGYRAEVREIPLVLDTLTVDGDAREVHAVWRCTTAEPTDCTHLVVFHHRLGETVDLGRAAVALIERQREAEAEAQAEAPPVDARASMAPPSVVPLSVAPPSVAPPSVTAPSVADAAARQAQRGDLAGVSASVAGQLARGLEASAPAARPLDETKLAELEAREAAARDRWMRSIASRRELERAVASGESCAGLDLSELDLSDLRLENADLSGANLRGTLLRGAMLSRVSLDGAILDGADVSGARFVAVSMLEASLVECQGLGARLEDCNLRDAVLERASWPRVHFQRVRAQGAILRGATASECWFEECDLTHADFGEATVESTLFTRCDASDAHFGEGAILKRARFEQCRLRGLRAFEAECEELSLTESMAERARFGASKLARARFLAVNLERADFSKADLTEAAFGRCHLRKARLDEAKLERAQLLSADLYQARLENADLRNADLRGANLFQAELLGARLEGARLDLANLTGTRLEAR